MNTEKDPKKDKDLLQKNPEKREKSVYISKRTGLRHRKITIMIPETVYRDILEEVEREYGKPSPRKVSEILIRAFYYYKNHGMIQIKSISETTKTEVSSGKSEKKDQLDIGEMLNQALLKIPQTERLKEKFVKVLYTICRDRGENTDDCVLSLHQVTSSEIEGAIIESIGLKRDTIENHLNAFIRSGLLNLITENRETKIKIFTIMMDGKERKYYLDKLTSKLK